MTTIRQEDFIQSVEDALQYISYYHPLDYIAALGEAYEAEQSPAAKDAIAQILTNSRMCAEGHRPICQDTGIVCAFVSVGMDVKWEGATMPVAEMVNEGVRRMTPGSTARFWRTSATWCLPGPPSQSAPTIPIPRSQRSLGRNWSCRSRTRVMH